MEWTEDMVKSFKQKSEQRVDKDQTLCPICLEQFKSPKFLSCLHTFCAECINQIEENRYIICPLCRVKTSSESGGVDCLRHNYFIESMIHISNAKVPNCEACPQKIISEHYCYDCQQYICQSCFSTHQGLRISRTHRSTRVGSEDNSHMTLKSYCVRHRDEELRFVCKKCNKTICRDCKATNHDGHRTIDIEECRKESKAVITQALEKIDTETDHLESRKSLIGYLDEVFKDASLSANGELAKLRKRMHETVNEKCDSLQKALNDAEKEQTKSIEEMKHVFSSAIHSLVWRRNHIRSVLQFGTTADLVETNRMINELSSDTNKETSQPVHLRFRLPSICTDAEQIVVPRLLHFKDNEVNIPLKLKKVSSIVLRDIYPLWISKLQVTDENDCYISLQHAHKSVAFHTLSSLNLVRYKESGDMAEFKKGPPVKDIVWLNKQLLVFSEGVINTIPPTKEEANTQGSKEAEANINRFINKPRYSQDFVCAFKNSDNCPILLNAGGQLTSIEGKVLRRLAFSSLPASAACSKSGNIVVCFPDEKCVIQYNNSGTEIKRYDNSTCPVLPKSFQPRDIALDANGIAYTVDYENDSVFSIDIENCIVLSFPHSCKEIASPLAVAIDKKGRVWIGHSKDKIMIFSIL